MNDGLKITWDLTEYGFGSLTLHSNRQTGERTLLLDGTVIVREQQPWIPSKTNFAVL